MRCVFVDFGFARKEESNGRMSIVGTDAFCAPEVLLGEDYCLSADIFSLGVTMAEMMCRVSQRLTLSLYVRVMADAAVGQCNRRL